jgi:hypothetical protein
MSVRQDKFGHWIWDIPPERRIPQQEIDRLFPKGQVSVRIGNLGPLKPKDPPKQD